MAGDGGLRVRKPGGRPLSVSEHFMQGLLYALGSEPAEV